VAAAISLQNSLHRTLPSPSLIFAERPLDLHRVYDGCNARAYSLPSDFARTLLSFLMET
jgi:hypothetical protein